MKFFNVCSRSEATAVLDSSAAGYLLGSETVPTASACGRVTAAAVSAGSDVPAFNRSTVDGYAIRNHETHGASDAIPALADLAGTVEMGKEVCGDIAPGQTMYVPTGGMLPASADSVVMIEDSEKLDDTTIGICKAVSHSENVVYKGDDISCGAVAVNAGKKLSPMDIGVLAALGIPSVDVVTRPTVAIISTGDEIIDIDRPIETGQIYDINGYVIENLVREAGGDVVSRRIIHDDYDALFSAVDTAAGNADIVILSGGSSVGTHDFTCDVISALDDSELFVQGVAMKPGKPTIIGRGKGKLIFGLPGHPAASIMVYKAFVEYYLRALQNLPQKTPDFIGTLSENIHSAPGKTTYQMVTLSGDPASLEIVPKFGKSGMISLLSEACGYIVIESHQEGLNAGETVTGYYL